MFQSVICQIQVAAHLSSLPKMPPRPQFDMEKRNWVMMEYHKRKGARNFLPPLLTDFATKFPGVRIPHPNTIRKIFKKQLNLGTVNNVNSASSPGQSHSGRRRTVRTDPNKNQVKALLDRDAGKRIGDATVSPVNSARLNSMAIDKST